MILLSLPVSGERFVAQLGGIQLLCEGGITPDIMLASSGGNIAAYVAAAADWKWAGVERIAQEIRPNLLSQPWNNISAISSMIGYFKGNVYNNGLGIKEFLEKFFDKETIIKYEIWTGTFNKELKKSKLFCNKKEEDCILNTNDIDYDLTQSEKTCFANGDIDIISKSCIASASIPGLVPPQKIDKYNYIDGGVFSASPLSILHEPILRYTCKNKSKLHMIYLNCCNLSEVDTTTQSNILDTLKQASTDLIRCQNVIDRLSTYELLRCFPGEMNKEEFECNSETIIYIKEIYNKCSYSMLEIYPTKNCKVNIINFTRKDIIDNINLSYNNCKCRFWWLSDVVNSTNIDDICKTPICDKIS
jgi:hypothetical protein